MTELYQQLSNQLHERRRTAHQDPRHSPGSGSHARQHLGVDPSREALPTRRRTTRAGPGVAPDRRAGGAAARRRTRTRSTHALPSHPRAASSSYSHRHTRRSCTAPRCRPPRAVCRRRRRSTWHRALTTWSHNGWRPLASRPEPEQLLPRSRDRPINRAADQERPLIEPRARCRASRENRKVVAVRAHLHSSLSIRRLTLFAAKSFGDMRVARLAVLTARGGGIASAHSLTMRKA